MGKFTEDEKGPRSKKSKEYPETGDISEVEIPGANSAVGGLVTSDTDVDAMLSAATPEQEESYEDPVQDKSREWGGAEAVAIEEEVQLNNDYFSDLNSEIQNIIKSENLEKYVEADELEDNQMRDYDHGAMVSTGSIGKRISVTPTDAFIDESLEEEYDEITESLNSVVSQNSPKRLMAFTQISEQEERVSQPEIYESENSLAQPTVSLVTDEWAEEGLVKKYENGDVEITHEGKTVMNVINEVEKDMYR